MIGNYFIFVLPTYQATIHFYLLLKYKTGHFCGTVLLHSNNNVQIPTKRLFFPSGFHVLFSVIVLVSPHHLKGI